MSLDIRFTLRQDIVCPKCGEIVGQKDLDSASSGGRAWYPFLESIGYYVPYEQRTEENDWYGKDMVLTNEQTKSLLKYARKNDVYNEQTVSGLVALALCEELPVVVNADW